MVKFSFVNVEVCLALFIGYAQVRLGVNHQLVALHEVEHGILEAWNQFIIIVKNVEIDELIGNDLELVDAIDIVNESLYVKRVVLPPLKEIFGCLQTLI